MPLPPFDRPVALACTLQTVRSRWLYVRCACGYATPHPIRLMLRNQPERTGMTVADALVRLRCNGCAGRELTVHLCQNAYGPPPVVGSVKLGWALLLHDGQPERPPAASSTAAE